ncbi:MULTISPECIES: IclR family transcriptional regulator [Rhodopseudomonas]|uniref:IclR family transcriptional regulator n=1 Tax=Rhodopseudomonas TaxID=1073 RepID=UPI0006962F4C|nr:MULTISPECIES: IclR family transcriptional regulator [Rhodopseudomonas]MDF3810966.1 IclR family transcriptional regulator [Rhodopseudomonas sp. BAL398]WOK16914.1 IclR family transcriptional regulator [Rhodopseudomonas sp. BAL398]
MAGKDPTVRPGAPALEKGLDLIEALAAESRGLNQKQIAERVGRSVGEIFRMLSVLEERGYVLRDPITAEYTLTLQLFRIAAQFPPTKRLQQAALPAMEKLTSQTGLSCHLAVLSSHQFMVIAQMDPEWQMGWSVRLGATFPMTQDYASAKVLAAFQLEDRRRELAEAIARHDRASLKTVLAGLAKVVASGGDFPQESHAPRLRAFSCPVLESSGRAVAALTIPLLRQEKIQPRETESIKMHLLVAARQISEKIGGSLA